MTAPQCQQFPDAQQSSPLYVSVDPGRQWTFRRNGMDYEEGSVEHSLLHGAYMEQVYDQDESSQFAHQFFDALERKVISPDYKKILENHCNYLIDQPSQSWTAEAIESTKKALETLCCIDEMVIGIEVSLREDEIDEELDRIGDDLREALERREQGTFVHPIVEDELRQLRQARERLPEPITMNIAGHRMHLQQEQGMRLQQEPVLDDERIDSSAPHVWRASPPHIDSSAPRVATSKPSWFRRLAYACLPTYIGKSGDTKYQSASSSSARCKKRSTTSTRIKHVSKLKSKNMAPSSTPCSWRLHLQGVTGIL